MQDIYVVGSTYEFQGTFTLDGTPWNLTTATVKLCFRRPDRSLVEKAATVTDAANGIAKYDSLATDLDSAGQWSRSWLVTDGAVIQESVGIVFYVVNSP